MPREFKAFIQSRTNADLIVLSQRLPVGQAADDLILIWNATNSDEWRNRMEFLPI
ncbi:MAG TPA: hypothetical protein VFA59_19735 [Vicinamibacterales bacterium]|nr:hypothetical protein [Vicinamibacterales bacterium]